MKKLKRYLFLLMLPAMFYVILQRDNIKYIFFQPIVVSNPSMVADLSEGRKIVIDQAGKRFYMVNHQNKVQFVCYGGSQSENSFFSAGDLVTDAEGHIYILDIIQVNGGQRIRKERVLEYDSKGNFIRVIFELEHSNITYKRQIQQLAIYDGELYAFVLNEDSFTMTNFNQNETSYPYKNANVMIVDFAVNPVDKSIYFTDHWGRIQKIQKNYEVKTAGSLYRTVNFGGKLYLRLISDYR